MKKMTFKTKQEVFDAVADGKLAGYKCEMPKGWSIVNEKFPVTLEVDTKAKTYKVYVAPEKAEPATKPAAKAEPVVETKKGFNWKKFWIIFGSVVGGLVVAAGIVCGILFTENAPAEGKADSNATIEVK